MVWKGQHVDVRLGQILSIYLIRFKHHRGIVASMNLADNCAHVLHSKAVAAADIECFRRAPSGQQMLNKLLKMRPIPRIQFVEERAAREAGRVEELLDQIRKKT